MTLAELAALVDGQLTGGDVAAVAVSDVVLDDRSVRPGDLFGCIPGARFDGHDFARSAVERGAVALLAERPLADLDVPAVLVRSVRAAVGPIAHLVHGSPSRAMSLVGVTGTSGKTTVTHLVSQMLGALGRASSLAGTLSGPRTTAEAPDVCRWLADLAGRDAHDAVAVMEVSSHGLEMGRVDGLEFAVAAFLNLSAEHLDFHGDMERYFAAKAKLFDGRARVAVVSDDDPWGARLARDLRRRGDQEVRCFRGADLADVEVRRDGLRMRWAGHEVSTSIIGRHNVANFAATAAIGAALGLADADIAAGLCATTPVAGRMETVERSTATSSAEPVPLVLVDYAHKPGALAAVLTSCCEIARASGGKVAVVMGAGGDRDVAKRPEMGRVAAQLADAVTITTDNPRTEDPAAIARSVRAGADEATVSGARADVVEIADRREAIFATIGTASANDVVVVAGKGHEDTQEFATRRVPFSDKEVAEEALATWRSVR